MPQPTADVTLERRSDSDRPMCTARYNHRPGEESCLACATGVAVSTQTGMRVAHCPAHVELAIELATTPPTPVRKAQVFQPFTTTPLAERNPQILRHSGKGARRLKLAPSPSV